MGCVGVIFAFEISNASWYAFWESSTTAVKAHNTTLLRNTKRLDVYLTSILFPPSIVFFFNQMSRRFLPITYIITYYFWCRLWLLLRDICSSLPSFSGRILWIQRCSLWGSGICPGDPVTQNTHNID